MKILVFSDTHESVDFMREGVEAHLANGGIDLLVHLGDGSRDFAIIKREHPGIPTISVAGNGEEFYASYLGRASLVLEQTFQAGGLRFLAVHGHRLHVKNGMQFAADYAISKGADVLLYGHTHVRADEVIKGTGGGTVRTINPGTAGRWYNASYALLHVVNGQLVCGFATK